MASDSTLGQDVSSGTFQLSLRGKLDLVPGVLDIVGTAIYTALTAPFRGDAGAHTFKQHVSNAVIRRMITRLSTPQLQYIGGPFSHSYKKWCQETRHTPEFVHLKSGCSAFWLGDYKTAKYVFVYYHGGGFSLSADDVYLKYWSSVQDDLKASGISVAFLFLEYTLVPHATYPTQICQGVETLNYVLTDLKRPASEILIGGDSAGANLCLAILSHWMHPSAEFPELKVRDGEKLKAVVLMGPWVSFRLDWPSEPRNRYKDVVTHGAGKKWSQDYLAGKASSNYTEAIRAPADWWENSKAGQMLVVYGADELLVDAIDEWVGKYKSVNPDNTTNVAAKYETHIEPIANLKFGDTRETEQDNAIRAFLKAKL